MAERKEIFFPSSDGVHTVHGALWLPGGVPRGVIQLVHGMSEHIGRYGGFGSYLADNGFVVTGHDHLGHGRTAKGPEEYGYLADQDGWRHLADDAHTLRERTGRDFPGVPYFLLGHSMGSFVVRTYLIDWPGTVDGALLSGTGQEPGVVVLGGKVLSGALCALGRGHANSRLLRRLSTGAYNQHFRPTRTAADWTTRDTDMVDAYVRDPLCQFTPTASMFHDMMKGLQYVARRENLNRMDPKTPVLFFSGDKDPVGADGAGVQKVAGWFRKAGVRDVTVTLYPGGRHEMLNETNRAEVYSDLLAWVGARLS